jgi:magnesium transporter
MRGAQQATNLNGARRGPASGPEASDTETVERYVVRQVPIASPYETVATLRDRLFARRYEDATHIFVVTEKGGLAGVINIKDIIGEPPSATLAELARKNDFQTVTLTTDREAAATKAIHAGTSVVGVCEPDGRFIGALPASALVSILRDEHLEDLHHMVGILGKSEAAKAALTASPYRRALYRLPWLLVGMAGSAIATATMVRFETQIAANIAVAFFIPAIVYLADAVGTQTEAVAVRGLSLSGADLFPLLAGEIGTGILIGVTLGSIAYPIVWFTFGSAALAATVAFALVVAGSVAATIGFLLPWSFAKVGYDPALGSGPVGTVVQDVLSLLIYFFVASILVF